MFGTLADFDALVAKAHALGLKVIIDLVISHTSDQHPWFKESRPVARQREGRLVCLGRPQARRHAAQQLAVDLRRLGLGVGRAPPAILPAQFPAAAARPQLPQPGSAGRAARRRALLARARRRRLPPRHGQLLLPRQAAARQSGADRKPRQPRPRRSVNPYNCRTISTTRASRRTSLPRALPRRCSTSIRRHDRGRRGRRRRSARSKIMAAYTSGSDAPAHVLHLRLPRAGDVRRGACSRRPSEDFERGAPATAGPAGPSPTTTWCAMPRAGRRHAGPRRASRSFCIGAAAVAARLGLPLPGRGTRPDRSRPAPSRICRTPTASRFWPEFKGRDGCRTPMVWEARRAEWRLLHRQPPWLPVPAEHMQPKAVDRQAGDPASVLDALPALPRVPQAHPALRQGRASSSSTADGDVLAFTRKATATRRLVCVFNFGADDAGDRSRCRHGVEADAGRDIRLRRGAGSARSRCGSGGRFGAIISER